MGRPVTKKEVREAKAAHAAFWLTARTPPVIRKAIPDELLAEVYNAMVRADQHGTLAGPFIPYSSRAVAERILKCPLRWVKCPGRWEGHKGKHHRPVAVVYLKKKRRE